MATEIERKFLIKGEFMHLAVRKVNILQHYLSADPYKTVRIRISDDNAFLSVKSQIDRNSIIRNEWEFPISLHDANEMLQVCLPGSISKTRYLVPSGKHTFEVDVFHGKNEGLVIAEVELSNENEEFYRPVWLGEEVTGMEEYYNVNLIK